MKMPKLSRFSAHHLLLLILMITPCSAIKKYAVLNPASLSLAQLDYPLLNYAKADIYATNNSLILSQIYDNFQKDVLWDSAQKALIFNSITDTMLVAGLDGTVTPVEFYSRYFSISLQYHELLTGKAPKDFVDLAFWGNNLNRQYDFNNFAYNRLSYYDVSVSFAYPVINRPVSEESQFLLFKQLTLGGRFHWLKGNLITQTDSSHGYILTTPSTLIANGFLYQSIAQGANNFAFDIGALADFQNSFYAGIALANLNTGFQWATEPRTKLTEIKIDSFSLDRYFETGSIDSFYQKQVTTYNRSSFKTSLPPELLLQINYQPTKLLDLSVYFHQYLAPNIFTSDFLTSANLNCRFNLLKFLSLELSYTTNFKNEYIIGTDFLFLVNKFGANLYIDNRNGFLGNAKGLSLGISFSQLF